MMIVQAKMAISDNVDPGTASKSDKEHSSDSHDGVSSDVEAKTDESSEKGSISNLLSVESRSTTESQRGAINEFDVQQLGN